MNKIYNKNLFNNLIFIKLPLAITLLLSSCSDNYKEYISNYKIYLSSNTTKFDSNLTTHFPDKVDSLYEFNVSTPHLTDTTDLFYFYDLFLTTYQERNKILKMIISLKKNAKAIYTANDSCLLIVHPLNYQENDLEKEFSRIINISETINSAKIYEENSLKYIKAKLKNCKDTLLLPVPNFSAISFQNERISINNHLTNDFKLYVLEAKKGNFSNKYPKSKGLGLPDKWKNGFSRGIAISLNKNIVIYWLTIW